MAPAVDMPVIRDDHEVGRCILQAVDQPAEVAIDAGDGVGVLLRAPTVRMTGLIDVGKVQDEQLGLVLLGEPERLVDVCACHVLFAPRPHERCGRLPFDPVERLEVFRSYEDGPTPDARRGVEDGLHRR